jgi:hypothetical protein
MKTIALLALTVALSGCAAPLYEWGHYEQAVWDLHRPNFVPEKEVKVLSKEIDATLKKGRQVPPGEYAMLGFLYYRLGDLKQATDCLLREKELYPESATFVDGMIRRMP